MGHVKQEKSTSSNNNNTTTEPPSFIEFISLKDHPRQKKKSVPSNATEESHFEKSRLNCSESKSIGFEKFQHNSRENQYPKQLNAEELISQINCNLNGSHLNNAVAHHNNTSNNLQNEVRNNNNSNNNDSNNNNSHSNNRSSCNQQQQQPQQRSQLQRAESVEADDVEKGSDDQSQRNRRQKPLFRRLYSFFRSLWIGATFNVGKAGKHSFFILVEIFEKLLVKIA